MYFTHSKSTWELRKFGGFSVPSLSCFVYTSSLYSWADPSVCFLSCRAIFSKDVTNFSYFCPQYNLWAGIIPIAYGQDEGQTHQNSLPGVIGETCRRAGSKLEAPDTRVSRRGLVFVNKSLQPQAVRMRKDAGWNTWLRTHQASSLLCRLSEVTPGCSVRSPTASSLVRCVGKAVQVCGFCPSHNCCKTKCYGTAALYQ